MPSTLHRPARDVVEPADQRDQRGLARTGRADDGGGGARPGRDRNILQHRAIRAGIAECGVRRRLISPSTESRPHRLGGAGDRGLGRQHLGDPLRARRRPREHNQHERRQQHRHQDLHEVGQERDQRADLHLAGVDAHSAEPDQRHAGDVDHQRGHRQHQRLPAARGQARYPTAPGWPRRIGCARTARGRRRGSPGCPTAARASPG